MSNTNNRIAAAAGIAGLGIVAALTGAGSANATVTVLDHDGTYAIPGDIAPGQYMTYHANQDCEWAVYDASGNTLFSGGIGAAIRGTDGQIQIGIGGNAASFSTTSCGTWQLVNDGRQPTGQNSGSSGLGF
ncbi:hypothetical protein [Nocardia sp. NPDC020380]|uniref:hypothetical protein n=1 Tax=Nocardia sp. NPDC020380 TaxID=3364309 RepID=UPI0037A2E055